MVGWTSLFGSSDNRNRHRFAEEARARKYHLENKSITLNKLVLPSYHDDNIPSAIDPEEVTKVALRLRYLIEEAVPCELEENAVTKPHSRIITQKVIRAAKEAGGDEFKACVVYCLLVNKMWFKKQAFLELWDADLYQVRAVACEVIAKAM